jgi:hypothetical protein
MQLNARISADRTLRVPTKPRLFDYGFGDLLPEMCNIAIYTASLAGARCAMLGGGGIGEHEASAVTGGGIEEQPCAARGGGGISDPERAGRRALADAASPAPDSISL